MLPAYGVNPCRLDRETPALQSFVATVVLWTEADIILQPWSAQKTKLPTSQLEADVRYLYTYAFSSLTSSTPQHVARSAPNILCHQNYIDALRQRQRRKYVSKPAHPMCILRIYDYSFSVTSSTRHPLLVIHRPYLHLIVLSFSGCLCLYKNAIQSSTSRLTSMSRLICLVIGHLRNLDTCYFFSGAKTGYSAGPIQ